jgi:hypothetical protein
MARCENMKKNEKEEKMNGCSTTEQKKSYCNAHSLRSFTASQQQHICALFLNSKAHLKLSPREKDCTEQSLFTWYKRGWYWDI